MNGHDIFPFLPSGRYFFLSFRMPRLKLIRHSRHCAWVWYGEREKKKRILPKRAQREWNKQALKQKSDTSTQTIGFDTLKWGVIRISN